MEYTPNLQKKYKDDVVPALMKEFKYKSTMQVPKLQKIVFNQGIGDAITDKKLIDTAIQDLSAIAGQAAVSTISKIDIDKINKILGLDITFVTSANTDEEGYALLREFGLPFKNIKR
mgnify:CR=1 FL=1